MNTPTFIALPDESAPVMPRGLYADRLPRFKPTLYELMQRAVLAKAALRTVLGKGNAVSDREYCRLDEADYCARAALRAELINLGLTLEQIKQLGDVL